MNYTAQKLVLIPLLLLCATAAKAVHISGRSYSVNTARELVGWTDKVNKFDMQSVHGTVALTLGGGVSFRSDRLAHCLFGDDLVEEGCDCCPTLNISGSRVADRGAKDWLADYFGLPTDFKSKVRFEPRIRHFVADFNTYWGFDKCVEGLFLRVHAPIAWARWDLNMCETVEQPGERNHAPGYFAPSFDPNMPAPNSVDRDQLLDSFTQFMNGTAPSLSQSFILSGTGTIVTFNPLCACRISQCDNSLAKLSDLRVTLGWNFLQSEDYHMGLGLIFAAPTGSRPKKLFVFEPIVGNGHHWELGVHLTSHYTFWRSEDELRHCGMYVDANITHLFKDCQPRCFDLCGKPNSKYMLAQKIGLNASSDPRLDGAANAGVEFANEFTQVANLTRRNVDVKVNVQADLSVMFNFTCNAYSFDLGYNFWHRGCEDYDCPKDCKPCDDVPCSPCNTNECAGKVLSKIEDNTWALKGDAHVFGYERNTNAAVNLAATQSKATIHAGTNNFVGPNGNDGGISGVRPTANPGIDAPQLATSSNAADVLDLPSGGVQTRSSNEPIFLKESDLDLNSERSKAQTHKIFAHFAYTWIDKDNWAPYVGVGVESEWGPSASCKTACKDTTKSCDTDCKDSCDDCINCGVSQWSVWVKTGIAFH